MKFNTPPAADSDPPIALMRSPEPGDVYPAKGGRGDTKYWLVVSINSRGYASVLGLDEHGNVVSGQTYGAWAFKDRRLLGRCSSIASINLDIEWEPS